MASEENKILQGFLKPVLKDAGYKKKGATWHCQDEEFVRVLNIQGSQWSTSFYLNLGIYIRALGDESTPTEYKCHIRQRIDGIVPDRAEAFRLLDFNEAIDPIEREKGIKEIVSDYGLKWLKEKSSIEGLKQYLTHEKKHGLPISKKVWPFLGINQKCEPGESGNGIRRATS